MTAIKQRSKHTLPFTRNLTWIYILSTIIALFTAGLSIAGILYPSEIYPTDELVQGFFVNDVVTLVISVPVLLGSMYFARRGSLLGLLFWPGALFSLVYNYIVYVFAMPLDWAFVVCLFLLVLSLYSTIGLVASMDANAVKGRLVGQVPERLAGGVLVALSVLFLIFVIVGLIMGITSQSPYPETELALIVSDMLVIPSWLIGGVLLWQHRPLGYVGGTGLLFQGSMMFIGLIVVMLLGPVLTGAEYQLTDYIQVVVYSLIALVPFGSFVRGVVKSQ